MSEDIGAGGVLIGARDTPLVNLTEKVFADEPEDVHIIWEDFKTVVDQHDELGPNLHTMVWNRLLRGRQEYQKALMRYGKDEPGSNLEGSDITSIGLFAAFSDLFINGVNQISARGLADLINDDRLQDCRIVGSGQKLCSLVVEAKLPGKAVD